MKNKKKRISIISAFYNEEQNLRKFITNFDNTRSKLIKKGYSIKLVLVNDGSDDNSEEIVQKFIKKKKYIKLINLKKNYGQQLAIFFALKSEKADFYGALDSDCQQDPKYFIKMIEILSSKKVQLVQMRKKYGNYESKIKKFFSKNFYYLFSNFAKIEIDPGSSDFYLFTKNVRNKIVSSKSSKLFLRGFIHLNDFKKYYYDYTPLKRTKGNSKYTTLKQIEFALSAMYLFARKYFYGILVLSFMINIFFLFINSNLTQQKISEVTFFGYLSIIFGLISLFLSIGLIYFLLKIYKKNQ